MTNEQILKKAIEKAVKNGYRFTPWINTDYWGDKVKYADDGYLHANKHHFVFKAVRGDEEVPCTLVILWAVIIFSHDFAKAFWGEEIISSCCEAPLRHEEESDLEYCKKCDMVMVEEFYGGLAWVMHLQEMVLEKKPLKYLEKFL